MNEVHKKGNGVNEIGTSVRGIRDGLPYFLIGGAIGTTLALLFAPKSGNELRGNIADVTRSGFDTTLEKARLLKEQSTEAMHAVREKAESVYDFASGKLALAKNDVVDGISALAEPAAAIVDPANETDVSATHARSGRKASNIL